MSDRAIPASICAAVLLTSSSVAPAQGGNDVGAQYRKGRLLQANGRYRQAIKVFIKLKGLHYHPILDYRIGECHEALKRYRKAIDSYRLYVKFCGTKRRGKKHPTRQAVLQRIHDLQKRAGSATPAPTRAPPGPGPAPSAQARTPPAHVKGTPRRPGQPTVEPHPSVPRGGVSPGQPPPTTRKKHRGFPRWRAFYVAADVGYNGVAGEIADNYHGGVGGYIGFFYRPLLFLSAGVFGTANYFRPKNNAVLDDLTSLVAGLEVRGHLPLRAWASGPWYFELWASFMAGYAHLSSRVVGAEKFRLRGPAVGFGLGAELYPLRWLSVGMNFRGVKAIYDEACYEDTGCVSLGDSQAADVESDLIFYMGLSATFHFFVW